MSDTPTPFSDAHIIRMPSKDRDCGYHEVVPLEVARQLEERAEKAEVRVNELERTLAWVRSLPEVDHDLRHLEPPEDFPK